MSGTAKTKKNIQLAGALITLAITLALLVAMVVCMRRCAAEWPRPSLDASGATIGTRPSLVPEATLVPNPYTAADFEQKNGYLTCTAGKSMLGVDVSSYQGIIDWQKVADAGVEFAMIRVGFRAWGTQGELHKDLYWKENLQGAADAGLQVGVYFFSQAISEAEAVEEARYVLALLDGAELQLPIVFDWETVPSEDARTNGVSSRELNDFAHAFCREVEAAGYDPMVYFNLDFAKWRYDLLELQAAGFDFWLAMYSEQMTYANRVQMWQYSCTGTVPGISTNVDLNLYFPYD